MRVRKYKIKWKGTAGHKYKLPNVLSKEQMVRILKYVTDARMAMVIFIGAFQGLRIGEIVRLKWEDVDLDNGELIVRDGKNTKRYQSGYGKDRVVPINDMFIPVYRAWKTLAQDEYVLTCSNHYGTRANVKSIMRNFQDKFDKILKKADFREIDYIQKNGFPRYKYCLHTLRHVCGTNLKRAGMDIYEIKDFLGHESVETTQLYCELAKDDIKEAAHVAYAYPKARLTLPQLEKPLVEVTLDKESLMLQERILTKKLELMKMQVLAKVPYVRV